MPMPTDPTLSALAQRMAQLEQAYASAQALADQYAADLARYRAGVVVRDARIAELDRALEELRSAAHRYVDRQDGDAWAALVKVLGR